VPVGAIAIVQFAADLLLMQQWGGCSSISDCGSDRRFGEKKRHDRTEKLGQYGVLRG
jgi:hypothetical protein